MSELVRSVSYFSQMNQNQQLRQYPLQRRFIVWGLWAGGIASTLFWSLLAGFSILVLFVAVGTLWRRDEPPILAFCIAFQWLSISAGFFYQQATGDYPTIPILGNLEKVVFLSLVGLLVLTLGIRAGFRLLKDQIVPVQRKLQGLKPIYDIRRMFWYVIALYTINWFVEIMPMAIMFDAAQFIYRILEFRQIFLFLLFLIILQQQRGYLYGATALVFVLVPNFASMMSAFKGVFIFLFVALLSEWRPWSRSFLDRRRTLRMALTVVGVTTTLLVMSTIWQGGIKHIWRPAIRAGTVTGSPVEKVRSFLSIVPEVVAQLEPGNAFESLTGRVSSGIVYFSHVVERVPELVPHENGKLILRALEHSIKPRILFPDKPNLGSDSWLIWEYAGRPAAGIEQGTSIGLGYMAEFYIDFGTFGMFIPVFFYGLILGIFCGILLLYSPSYNTYLSAVAVMFLGGFTSYEGEIAKLLGGFVLNVLVFGVVLHFAGPWLHGKLMMDSKPSLVGGPELCK